MGSANPQLVRTFRKELELCEVTEDESLIILHQAESREGYKEAILGAAESLGVSSTSFFLPGFKHSMFPYGGDGDIEHVDTFMEDNPHILRALQQADIVFDITAEGLVHTKTTADILSDDARVVLVKEPPAILERMLPRPELRERVLAANEMIQSAQRMRVTSEAGTDITVNFDDEVPTVAQYGYSPESGHWDNFPGGFLATYPVDDSPSGTIVIDVGDVVLPMGRYVDNPITVEIEDGFITDIDGDDATQTLIEGYLGRWEDPDAFATSHFGFGLDQTGEWENWAFSEGQDLMGQDFRGYAGGFMWSTGPNRYVDRYTRAHLDIVMRNCSFYVDGEEIIRHGEIIDPRISP